MGRGSDIEALMWPPYEARSLLKSEPSQQNLSRLRQLEGEDLARELQAQWDFWREICSEGPPEELGAREGLREVETKLLTQYLRPHEIPAPQGWTLSSLLRSEPAPPDLSADELAEALLVCRLREEECDDPSKPLREWIYVWLLPRLIDRSPNPTALRVWLDEIDLASSSSRRRAELTRTLTASQIIRAREIALS